MFIHKTVKILIVIIVFIKFDHITLNEAILPFFKTKTRWPHFELFITKLNIL